MLGLTRGAALEYGAHGIRINAICPGGVLTPLAESFMDEGTYKAWADTCPPLSYGWDTLAVALLRVSTAVEDHETLALVREGL